jgi:hypothetical protein
VAVFWVVASCRLVCVCVCVYHRFGGPYASKIRAIALMMEAVKTSETSVNFYQSARCYNPEDSHLLAYHRENLNLIVRNQVS